MLNKESLQNTLAQFLRTWTNPESQSLDLITTLRCYRQLMLSESGQKRSRPNLAQTLITNGLARLAERNPNAAHLLTQRYLEGQEVKHLTRELSVSDSQFYKIQNQAIEALTETILAQEQQAQFDFQLTIESRLEPLRHHKLFGVDQLQQQLYDVVTSSDTPRLISIEGLGGIGKTSLADRLVRDLISGDRFFDIAWISAKQEQFVPAIGVRPVDDAPQRPALTGETLIDLLLTQLGQTHALGTPPQQKATSLNRLLKRHPYLIVIDNLETAADYQALIPTLRQLVDPSKFLLTSRHSLRAYADIYCLNVTELSQTDTLALLKHEAESRGLAELAQALTAKLAEIYQITGGNPLALKLVLGQLHALPLSRVLNNLKQAQSGKVMALYTYIYKQSWQMLSDASRQALLTLAVASPRGSTIDHLLTVSELPAEALSDALEELITFSLVDVGGGLETHRYSIHRLTETFLFTEVTQWLSSP